jgi:predicted translin family RNA/ssDNA-binding protein
MKVLYFFLLVPILFFSISELNARSKDDVNAIIIEVESQLEEYPGEIDKYASEDIEVIKKHIKNSKDLLKSNKVEEAYQEIMIAKTYFLLIDSKKELYSSEIELEGFKNEK